MAGGRLPAGVVNIVPGYGHTAGQHLAEHPGVDKIAFTGSTATGRKIVAGLGRQPQARAARARRQGRQHRVRRRRSMPAAVGGSAFAIFHNQGQACIAGSRLHPARDDRRRVPRRVPRAGPLDPARQSARSGDRDGAADLAAASRARAALSRKVAQQEGGEILIGGKAPRPRRLAKGCYVEPTVVRAKPADRVCQEEVFGPFVTVTTFSDDDEALAIANGTDYGLGGGPVDARPVSARTGWRASMQCRHGLDQLLQARESRLALRRRRRVGLRPRDGLRGDARIHRAKSVWVNVDAQVPPHYQR